MAHPFFASLNIKDLLNGTMENPLKLDLNQVNGGQIDTRFFNSKSAPQDLAETVLPQANLDKLKKGNA